jgi:GNAT superfamily N-acetyltransferase
MDWPEWRQMQTADIAGVVTVAATAFRDHFEDRVCFEERLALYPQGCFVLAVSGEVEPAVQGYLIAYPWPFEAIPPLNSLIGSVPPCEEGLYLHDLALAPAVHGQGHAAPIVERLADHARRCGAPRITLVSVNGSVPFWQRMGFSVVPTSPVIGRKLATYGPGAAYMARVL